MKQRHTDRRRGRPGARASAAKRPHAAPESEPATQQGPGADTFLLYLREVGQTALLSPEEERRLAVEVQQGVKGAREQMIKANLRLVVKIARDYEGLGVPLLDLISEGNIGLMKAVDRFRPDKGAKLSTYASWWIKQAIRQAVSEQSRTIRLPAHVQEKLLHIRKAEARFQEELGRPPTPEELSEEVGLDPRRLSRYKEASIRPLSLEARMGDDDSDTVAEVIPDERSERPDQELAEKMDVAILNSLLPSLDARERVVLQHRFGLDGTEERTLEEIGAEFGITRERTRQIQEGALVKLRRKMQEMEAAAVSE